MHARGHAAQPQASILPERQPDVALVTTRGMRREAAWLQSVDDGFSVELLFLMCNAYLQFLFCFYHLDIFLEVMSPDSHSVMASWTVSAVLLMYLSSISLMFAMVKFFQVKVSDMLHGMVRPRMHLWARWVTTWVLILGQASLSLAIVAEITLYRRHGIHIAGTHGLLMVRYLMTGGDIRFVLMAAQEDWTFLFVSGLLFILLVVCQYGLLTLWYHLQVRFRFGTDVELIRWVGALHFTLGLTAVTLLYFNPSIPFLL